MKSHFQKTALVSLKDQVKRAIEIAWLAGERAINCPVTGLQLRSNEVKGRAKDANLAAVPVTGRKSHSAGLFCKSVENSNAFLLHLHHFPPFYPLHQLSTFSSCLIKSNQGAVSAIDRRWHLFCGQIFAKEREKRKAERMREFGETMDFLSLRRFLGQRFLGLSHWSWPAGWWLDKAHGTGSFGIAI
jgi:hypothetical protein